MRKLIAGIFFIVFLFSAWAQDSVDNEAGNLNQNLVVSKINFTGLNRTKDSYIQSRVKDFVGNSLADTDIHDLETKLQLEGLFDNIKISAEQISDTEAQLNVSVKEKITFIPMPFAMYSNSGFMAGGVVLDSNAFGKKYMVMAGAFFSATSKSGILAFQKPSSGRGIPGISTFANFSNTTPKVKNLDDDVVLRYDSIAFGCGISLSEKIIDGLTFKNGYTFRLFDSKDYSGYSGMSPESIKYGSISLGLDYSKSDWNGFFLSTKSVSLSSVFGLTDSSDSDYRFPMTFAFGIGVEHPIFTPKLRMYQKISGSYGIKNHIMSYAKRDDASVTILPSSFVTDRIVGGNAGLEFAVAKLNWGMIAVYSDYQVVYAKDLSPRSSEDNYEFMHGPNGGVRFYLAKIAFPAIAVGVSYNVPKEYWQFAASVGMSF